MDFIINNILQIIGIVVPLIIVFIQGRRKLIFYEIKSISSLIKIDGEVEKDFQILYKGNKVKRVHSLEIKFWNAGNSPIVKEDFISPISIKLDQRSKVLFWKIIDKKFDNMIVDTTLNKQEIVIIPNLLNSRDTFSLQILIADGAGKVGVYSRIIGARKLLNIEENFSKEITGILIGSILYLISDLLTKGIQAKIYNIGESFQLVSVILQLFGMFFVIFSIGDIYRKLRKKYENSKSVIEVV